jgi:dTDP-glucose 4,6-dehydratase
MNILVTGGAGFIGSNFIRLLINETDHNVVNLDKLTYAGNLENLKDIENNPKYKFVKGDIADNELIPKLLKEEQIDIIVNFAAETHVDRSIQNADDFIKTDILGTFNLLESAKQSNIKRFIHISTDEVYGSIENGSFSEDSKLNPRNPYSASKASAELIINSYWNTYKLPIIITRSSNNFGPYQYPEKLIPLMVTNAVEDKDLPVYGDGKQIRDWIHVEDNCRGVLAVMEKGELGQVYNISAGNEVENITIVNSIVKNLQKPESLIKYVKDRPGHDRRYSITNEKIKQLGWQPNFNFDEALQKTIEWYKINEEWWKRIKSGEYLEYYKKQYDG